MVNFFVTAKSGGLERAELFKNKCWVDMVNPTDDECEDVSAASGVPEYMIKAALDEEERARADFDDGCSMFILDCPIIEETATGDSYTTLPLAVIIIGYMLKISYVAVGEFLAQAPLAPIAVFMLAIGGAVALAYFLAWQNVRKISLTQVLRDDTMM